MYTILQVTEKKKKKESSKTRKFVARLTGAGQELNKHIRKAVRFLFFFFFEEKFLFLVMKLATEHYESLKIQREIVYN